MKKAILKAYLREASKHYGVGQIELQDAMYTRSEEIKMARGAFLWLCKSFGISHKEACDYINLNYGNGSVYRLNFEKEVKKKDMEILIRSADEAAKQFINEIT